MITAIGFVACFAVVIISIMTTGNLMDFYDVGSIGITIGGCILATFISFPVSQLKAAVKSIKFFFQEPNADYTKDIEMIIKMATTARKGGLLALENEVPPEQGHFLKKGIMLIVDGSSSELVKNIMEADIDSAFTRHAKCAMVYRRAASYGPAFGMIGTLVGLINMLKKLDDVAALGPSMSVALVTTFYGSMLANMVFTPIAVKLDMLNDIEELRNRLLLEGMLSIQAGENPRFIKEKLESFIAAHDIKDTDAGGE